MSVIPTTELLNSDLKMLIKGLYSTLLSYRPLAFDGIGEWGGSFDGTPHALKTISNVLVQCGGLIHSLTVSYLDGSQSDQYGGPSDRKHPFNLRNGIYASFTRSGFNPDSFNFQGSSSPKS
jgi:hypothetical protein